MARGTNTCAAVTILGVGGEGTWSQCARTRHTSPRGKWSPTPPTMSAGTTQHCIAQFHCSTEPLVLSFEVPNKKVIRINHVWLSGASAEGGRNSGQDVGVRCVCFRYYTAPIYFRNAEECEDSALSRGCRGSQGRARHRPVLTSSGQGRRRDGGIQNSRGRSCGGEGAEADLQTECLTRVYIIPTLSLKVGAFSVR